MAINVVILEHSTAGFAEANVLVEALFNGYDCEIEITELRPGTSSADFGGDIFNKLVVDLIVTDLSFGDVALASKMNYVTQIKKLHNDIFLIALTGEKIDIFGESRTHEPDMLLNKRTFQKASNLQLIKNKFDRKFKINHYAVVDWESSNLSKTLIKKMPSKARISRSIRAITFAGHRQPITTAISKIVLKEVSGGYSSSVVLLMESYTKENKKCIDAILKISPRADGILEVENYQKYVSWYLHYSWRPELLGYVDSSKTIIMFFSYVNKNESQTCTLNDLIQNEDFDSIGHCLKNIFNPSNNRWYSTVIDDSWATQENDGTSIKKYYLNRWDVDLDKHDRILNNYMKDYIDFRNDTFLILDREYISPSKYLFAEENNIYQRSICHGDMHGDNIFLTGLEKEQLNAIFIDFRHTGPGHVFEDFAQMECSLRFQQNTNLELTEIVEDEIMLYRDPDYESKLPAANCIKLIRDLAKSNFPTEKFANYKFSVACISYRMIGLENMSDLQLKLLIAGIFASIRTHKDK